MVRRFIFVLIHAFCILLSPGLTMAQSIESEDSTLSRNQPVVIPALFEYIEVPESIASLQARSEYLLEHFWEPFDFNQKSVGQLPLEHAFKVYITPVRWASREATAESIASLIEKLRKNPTLHYQFVKAAENNLYGPNAKIWADEVYIPFIESLINNKKIKDIYKMKYADQLKVLRNTPDGGVAPAFEFTERGGGRVKFSPRAGAYSIIEFGHPDCDDCRMVRLRLDSDVQLEPFIRAGVADVYFIVPDAEADPEWRNMVTDYPADWKVGAADALEEVYDIRLSPSLYLISPDGKIMLKNATVDDIIYTIATTRLDRQQSAPLSE